MASPTARSTRKRRTSARRRKQLIPPPELALLNWRLLTLAGVLLLGFMYVGSRAASLQISPPEGFVIQREQQQNSHVRPYIPRRTIVDRNGTVLAVDHSIVGLNLSPEYFHLPKRLTSQLLEGVSDELQTQLEQYDARTLPVSLREQFQEALPEDLPTELVIDLIEDLPDGYSIDNKNAAVVYFLTSLLDGRIIQQVKEGLDRQKTWIPLGREFNKSIVEQISSLGISGVDIEDGYQRFYPQGVAAGDITGYVQWDDRLGKAGVEQALETLIQREPISLPIQIDRYGRTNLENLPPNAIDIDDWELELTIDLPLQSAAREALQAQIKEWQGKRGTVIVMDAHSGELLALVAEPTFDPNFYFDLLTEEERKVYQNWAVTEVYEPGSTFKPLMVALALEEGVITPHTTVNDPGTLIVDGSPLKNYNGLGHGLIDVAGILRVSSNIGMVRLMEIMPRDTYYDRLLSLQTTQASGIDLPSEAVGQLKSRKDFTKSPLEPATNSFGQGISLTPIKLVQLYAAIANGGKLVRPHLARGLFDSNGEPQEVTPKATLPTSAKALKEMSESFEEVQLFSPAIAKSVLEMMETVVTDGSGQRAKIPDYRIAGKTGTAEKATDTGRYISGAYITSFVSIFPVDNPRYVVFAAVDEPQAPNSFGGTVAAPVVREVLEALILQEKIPPSSLSKQF